MDSKAPLCANPEGGCGGKAGRKEGLWPAPHPGPSEGQLAKDQSPSYGSQEDLGWGQGTTCPGSCPPQTQVTEPVNKNELYVVSEKVSLCVCVCERV